VKVEVLARAIKGPESGADIRLLGPQPDISQSSKMTDRKPVQCVARYICLPLSFDQCQIILVGDRGNGPQETCEGFYAVAL